MAILQRPRMAIRAVTTVKPYRFVYAADQGKTWLVVAPETGSVQAMSRQEFFSLYVPETACPPAALKVFEGMPRYKEWQRIRK